MHEIKWIKIVTDIFDDEKIILIESMPDGDSIIVIWFKLLCMAGKQNNSGVFMLNERIAYTDEMLATIFRRPLNTVRLALRTFEQFGMIEIVNDAITIPNWGKHQSVDQIENRRAYMRDYMREQRKKQRAIAMHEEAKEGCKPNCKPNVSSADIDIEKELEIESDIHTSNAADAATEQIDSVFEAFNEICTDLAKITKKTDARKKAVKARLKENGYDVIVSAFNAVQASDFLSGRASEWRASFDWIMKPANFVKILEGNYTNRVKTATSTLDRRKEELRNGGLGSEFLI